MAKPVVQPPPRVVNLPAKPNGTSNWAIWRAKQQEIEDIDTPEKRRRLAEKRYQLMDALEIALLCNISVLGAILLLLYCLFHHLMLPCVALCDSLSCRIAFVISSQFTWHVTTLSLSTPHTALPLHLNHVPSLLSVHHPSLITLHPSLIIHHSLLIFHNPSGEKQLTSTSSRSSRTYRAVQKSHSMNGSEVTHIPTRSIVFHPIPFHYFRLNPIRYDLAPVM